MNIQLIEKFARISVNSIAKDAIDQWRKQDAIGKDEHVVVGIQHENGDSYITFRIEKNKNK